MADRITTILDVQLDAKQVAADLENLSRQIANVKKEQKQLDEEFKAGEVSATDYTKSTAAMKDELTWLQKQQKGVIATQKILTSESDTYSDSLNGQRQKLADMQKAYDQFTAAQRESASGRAFLEALKEQSDTVKELEEATGRAQRNVGNYPKVVTAAFPALDKLQNILGSIGVSMQDLSTKGIKAFSNLGTSVKAFGKAFITPPIVVITAVLSAILLVIDQVSKAFKKNDDAMTALQKAFAVFEPIGEAVAKIFDWVAKGVAAVATAAAKAVNWIAGGLSDAYKKAANEAQLLIDRQDKLEDSERNYEVNSAKRAAAISMLRDKAVQSDKYSIEERRNALKKALEYEQDNLKEERIIAKERLKALQEEAKLNSDSSDEMKNKIASARAAMYKAEQNYYDGKRKIDGELRSFDKEEQQRASQRQKEKERSEKEYQDYMIKTRRETEDALLSLEKDSEKKSIEQTKRTGERTIEDLRVKLSRLKDVDIEARNALNKLIEATEKETQRKITEIQVKASNERLLLEQQNNNKRAEIGIKDTVRLAEIRNEIAQDEYIRLQGLTDEEIEIIYKTRAEYVSALIDAEKEAYEAREDLSIAYYNRESERIQRKYNERVANIDNEYALAELEFEQKQLEYERLIELDEETKTALFENEEEYNAAVQEAQQGLTNSIENQIRTRVKSIGEFGNSLKSIGDALGYFADESQEAAKAQKAFTFAGIIMNQAQAVAEGGLAVAKGIESAAAIPFPANIPAILSVVSQIGGLIATVMSTIGQAKQIFSSADAGKFATGGVVGGESYTGDNLIAHVNSGEGIYTGKQANTILQQIANNPVSGNNIEELTAAFRSAVENVHPTLVYSEFGEFEKEVTTYEELAKV